MIRVTKIKRDCPKQRWTLILRLSVTLSNLEGAHRDGSERRCQGHEACGAGYGGILGLGAGAGSPTGDLAWWCADGALALGTAALFAGAGAGATFAGADTVIRLTKSNK